MKIAVIGSGISGLATAHFLSQQHDVTVFEANDYIGGHTATVDIELEGKSFAVDTGFIVFNDWNYPHFQAFLEQLNIASQPTEMGFSVSDPSSDFEYCGNNLNTLFAKRRHLLNPSFYRMLLDIMRFNQRAKADYAAGAIDESQSLFDYLQAGNYGDRFVSHYLLPMAAAIWSSSVKAVVDFQALFFIRFFYNHGLLNINKRPQWRVLIGGSRSYVEPMIAPFKDRLLLNSRVNAVTRHADKVELQVNQQTHQFDQVVLACHSDQALSLLQDASQQEQQLLSAIGYSQNSVILHTDESLLPKRKRAWTSWNYQLNEKDELPLLTYNMNILQRLDAPKTICVTVNGDDDIDESQIIRRFRYAHPQFNQQSVDAQSRWPEINGVNRTWFAGAYWRNGFHEDGFVSAMRVTEGLKRGNGEPHD